MADSPPRGAMPGDLGPQKRKPAVAPLPGAGDKGGLTPPPTPDGVATACRSQGREGVGSVKTGRRHLLDPNSASTLPSRTPEVLLPRIPLPSPLSPARLLLASGVSRPLRRSWGGQTRGEMGRRGCLFSPFSSFGAAERPEDFLGAAPVRSPRLGSGGRSASGGAGREGGARLTLKYARRGQPTAELHSAAAETRRRFAPGVPEMPECWDGVGAPKRPVAGAESGARRGETAGPWRGPRPPRRPAVPPGQGAGLPWVAALP